MALIHDGLHSCPTRIDGTAVRFSHAVTSTMCQGRQREHYHKCFTCVHKNGYTAPAISASASLAKLPEAPAAPAAEPLPELAARAATRAAV